MQKSTAKYIFILENIYIAQVYGIKRLEDDFSFSSNQFCGSFSILYIFIWNTLPPTTIYVEAYYCVYFLLEVKLETTLTICKFVYLPFDGQLVVGINIIN